MMECMQKVKRQACVTGIGGSHSKISLYPFGVFGFELKKPLVYCANKLNTNIRATLNQYAIELETL